MRKLILLILLLLCVSFVSAFTDRYGNICSDDPLDYILFESNGTISGASNVVFNFDDIDVTSNRIFTTKFENLYTTDDDQSTPSVQVRNDDDTGVSQTANSAGNWYYRNGSGDWENSGIDAAHATDWNITMENDMSNDQTNYTWVKAGFEGNINNSGIRNSVDAGEIYVGVSAGTVNWTGIRVWENTACHPFNDTTPPNITKSTYNHTTAVNTGNQTIWRTDTLEESQTTDSTITITFTATGSSNFSIGTSDKNFTDMIPAYGNKCATTDTTFHSCTVNETFAATLGSQCFYISGRDNDGNESSLSTSGCLNVTYVLPSLELDGMGANRSYEYYTNATLTTNLAYITVYDNTDRYINESTPLSYKIDLLRQNQFNDSTTEKNVTSAGSVFIELDNRTDIESFTFNLTNNGTASENISIDINADNVYDEILLGKLLGNKLLMDYFYSDSIKYSKINLTRSTAGTKTIYMNISTSGFSDSVNPVENFSFQLDGFTVDEGNDFNFTENFLNNSLSPGTFSENISLFAEVDDFGDNDSSLWNNDSSGTVIEVIDKDYLKASVSCGSACSISRYIVDTIPNFDMRKSYQFATNLSWTYGWSCDQDYEDMDIVNHIYLTDGTSQVELWSNDIFVNCRPFSQSGGGTTKLDLTGYKTSDDNIDIYLGNTFSRTVSTVSLSPSIRPYLKLEQGVTINAGNPSYSAYYSLWNISVSGISLKTNNSTYPITAVNYSFDSLNVTTTDIQRATLTIDESYNPVNTTVRYFLSNDNQTTWEEVTNGTVHVFTSSGKNLSARIQVATINESRSPLIYSYNVDITLSPVTNINVDVGADGVNDWNYTGTLNDTTSPQTFRSVGNATSAYVNINCKNNVTCYLPITITFGTPGMIQISNSNLTHNPNPINITPSLIESFNLINLTFDFLNGAFELFNLKLDFLGSKNITVSAHDGINEINRTLSVFYSKFNISLPVNISWFEFFPSSKDSKNVTPYSQINVTPIWNYTVSAYGEPVDAYVMINESLNSCLEIVFSNDSAMDNTTDIVINTSAQAIYSNIPANTGSFGIWNMVSLTNCSNRFYIPWFTFLGICSDCVRTDSWWTEVNLIEG